MRKRNDLYLLAWEPRVQSPLIILKRAQVQPPLQPLCLPRRAAGCLIEGLHCQLLPQEGEVSGPVPILSPLNPLMLVQNISSLEPRIVDHSH